MLILCEHPCSSAAVHRTHVGGICLANNPKAGQLHLTYLVTARLAPVPVLR